MSMTTPGAWAFIDCTVARTSMPHCHACGPQPACGGERGAAWAHSPSTRNANGAKGFGPFDQLGEQRRQFRVLSLRRVWFREAFEIGEQREGHVVRNGGDVERRQHQPQWLDSTGTIHLRPVAHEGGRLVPPFSKQIVDRVDPRRSRAVVVLGCDEDETIVLRYRFRFVVRRKDPLDGRSALVSLTPKAIAVLPEINRTMDEGNDLATEGLTEDEVAQAIGLMRRMLGNFERSEG